MGLFLQTIGTILLITGYIPQIISLYKNKNAEGFSVIFLTMITGGIMAIMGNLIISRVQTDIIWTQVTNAVLAVWVLLLVIKYKGKKKS